MDPKECLRLADQAISDGEYRQAGEHLDNYINWRMSGGFEPIEIAGTLMKGDAFSNYCQRRLVDATRCDDWRSDESQD